MCGIRLCLRIQEGIQDGYQITEQNRNFIDVLFSSVHIYNVIVLNNINGDCLKATTKSISLERVVSECVYVFKRVFTMAT